ncbi:tRNA lysidine(34) synthetase TilS [Aquibacillus koreensis]|uniref:tRNA(Ile)-lysidine synthase n=2 Tax=Aquibacillus koreensis TaxID=279446 RepID=A0A9X4AJT9_9BACI|nr:tRNA lysidine(34) synthetase TilS [Aquibacillus koreensis]MCT2534289.1 tRNA lysidine(34) synthetase TilS [Aquibacillus koreensis]MDC3422366.1 tRNA lysidine(34) synthetase TilS [Aquibacillus koreensis]
MMQEEVHAFIKKHHLFHKQATVLVGVSGGPDSLALLHYLCSIRKTWSFRLIALTVDHGLRGEESKQDVAYVQQICKQWDVECLTTTLNVKMYKEVEKKGTQLAARELRYQFFQACMLRYQADYLALGHHGDDQVETILMRIVRGTNPSALKGIPKKRKFAKGYIVRPFMCLSREHIESYCEAHQIDPRIDPSNEEDVYTRNYFRIHILPLLRKQNPSLHKNVQRLSESMDQDDSYLHDQALVLMDKVIDFNQTTREVTFPVNDFLNYPYALQRRTFHLILNYLYHTLPNGLSYVHEDHFFDVIHSKKPNVTFELPMGLKMSKVYETIRFHFQDHKPVDSVIRLEVPGSITLSDGSKLTATITEHPERDSKYRMTCPADEFEFPLYIRSRQQGDRMKIRGLNGSKKLKDIFIDEKISLHLRDTWPVVTDHQGNIVWLIGLKKGTMSGNVKSHSFLQLHYIKGNM